MWLEANVQAGVELVELLHVGIPFALQELVAIVVVEHMARDIAEAWEVAGPYEFVFALLAEVDGEGHVAELLGVGEGLLGHEERRLALGEVLKQRLGMVCSAASGLGVDAGRHGNGIHERGQCRDNGAAVAAQRRVSGTGGSQAAALYQALQLLLGFVGLHGAAAWVADVQQDDPFLQHRGNEPRPADFDIGVAEVGDEGYDELVFFLFQFQVCCMFDMWPATGLII